jgi:hypothetical protein
MTIFVIPILFLDFLLLLWILGHIPRHLYFPELNIPVFLMVPFIIGMVIYYDLRDSFGLFDTSEIPLFQHVELYLLFSLVYQGVFAVVCLAIRYYENQPRNSFYYQGISNVGDKPSHLSIAFNLLLMVISVLGILKFYFDHAIYR